VVEPHLLEVDLVGLDAEPPGRVALDVDRHVAEADRPLTAVQQRLGHDADRVGEVDHPGARCRGSPRQVGQLEDHRDCAQCLGESAGSRRLLPDGPEAQGERLVHQPRRLPADAELDEHEIGSINGRLAVRGLQQLAAPSGAPQHSLCQAADHREALGIDVMQRQLVDGEAFGAPRQSIDQLRGIGAPGTDHNDLETHRPALLSAHPVDRT
jgi:hypothetical protein